MRGGSLVAAKIGTCNEGEGVSMDKKHMEKYVAFIDGRKEFLAGVRSDMLALAAFYRGEERRDNALNYHVRNALRFLKTTPTASAGKER